MCPWLYLLVESRIVWNVNKIMNSFVCSLNILTFQLWRKSGVKPNHLACLSQQADIINSLLNKVLIATSRQKIAHSDLEPNGGWHNKCHLRMSSIPSSQALRIEQSSQHCSPCWGNTVTHVVWHTPSLLLICGVYLNMEAYWICQADFVCLLWFVSCKLWRHRTS